MKEINAVGGAKDSIKKGRASDSGTGQEEWAGLKGFLHAAHSGQGGQFAAEALRRMSQDSGGVRLLLMVVTACNHSAAMSM